MINSPGPTNLTDVRNFDLIAAMHSGRVLMTGAGTSGRDTIAMLKSINCSEAVVMDDSALDALVATDFSVRHVMTADTRDGLADVVAVMISPGWRPTSPLFGVAAEADVPVFDDATLASAGDCAQLWGPKRTWLVVTGTNGKTTTASILAVMLGGWGAAMGNIGVALYDALTAEPRIEVLAAELSSFQLHWASNIRPDAEILLSLAEDHTDWYGSYENYDMNKTRALCGAVAIYGTDDADVVERMGRIRKDDELGNFVVGFTDGPPEAHQVGARDGVIVNRAFDDGDAAVDDSEPSIVIASIAGISPPGRARVLGTVAATAMAHSIGTSPGQAAAVLGIFEVRAHRDQIVHKANDAVWIDDSRATSPYTADAALSSHGRVVWIVSGQLKGAEISPLMAECAHRLQAAMIPGVDGQLVNDTLSHITPAVPVVVISDTDKVDAMAKVYIAASEYVSPGGVVLSAPAAASLDMCSGMAERGDLFAQWTQKVTSTDG